MSSTRTTRRAWEVSSLARQPPLRPLHPDSSISQTKLDELAKLSTEELLKSLEPGRPGSLKTRADGTIVDGHHRIVILRERGIDVDALARDLR